jgi:hypothetical protein
MWALGMCYCLVSLVRSFLSDWLPLYLQQTQGTTALPLLPSTRGDGTPLRVGVVGVRVGGYYAYTHTQINEGPPLHPRPPIDRRC